MKGTHVQHRLASEDWVPHSIDENHHVPYGQWSILIYFGGMPGVLCYCEGRSPRNSGICHHHSRTIPTKGPRSAEGKGCVWKRHRMEKMKTIIHCDWGCPVFRQELMKNICSSALPDTMQVDTPAMTISKMPASSLERSDNKIKQPKFTDDLPGNLCFCK